MPHNNDILSALNGSPIFAPPTRGAGMDPSAILNMLMANKRPFPLGGSPSPATITGGMGRMKGFAGQVPWENSAKDLSDTAQFDFNKPLVKNLGTPYSPLQGSPFNPKQIDAANRIKTDTEKYNYAAMDQKLKSIGHDPEKMTDLEKVLAILRHNPEEPK
jgi:hypothetical protein